MNENYGQLLLAVHSQNGLTSVIAFGKKGFCEENVIFRITYYSNGQSKASSNVCRHNSSNW
jgi:hypothetical protein